MGYPASADEVSAVPQIFGGAYIFRSS